MSSFFTPVVASEESRPHHDDNHDDSDNDDKTADENGLINPHHRLSCQQCRQRKIKCDRSHPCMPCLRKKIDCTFPSGFKSRPKRHRALLSNSYEDKIDDISRKLDRLYRAMDKDGPCDSRNKSWLPTHSLTPRTSPETTASSQPVDVTSSTDAEGEPALIAQAAFATEYAQRAISKRIVSQEMAVGLENLTQMIRESQDLSTHPQPEQRLTDPRSKFDEIQLPPMELAISCVHKLRNSESLMFYWTWDIDTVGQVLEYTLTVYTAKPSTAELVIVNATLCRLFVECIREETDPSIQAELGTQVKQCEANLNIILSRLPFNLASNFDNVLALYQLGTYLIGQCNTLSAWKHIAGSVQMCQTLGYHGEVALVHETAQQKRRRKRLVWMIVILEKSLSLRLGRPSAIRDGDFTLERPSEALLDDISALGPASLMPKWIDFALTQGKVFDKIFSPGALLRPEDARVACARELATDLKRVFNATSAAELQFTEMRQRILGEEMDELFQRADRINYLATLTLIYRAIPADPLSDSVYCEECVATAHEALDEHQKCLAILKTVEGSVLEMYLQWAILSSPFVPFIVLFCRVFETSDPVHLEKLASVIETLQLLPSNLPGACRRQLQVFRPMYEVACNYIRANSHGGPHGHMVSGSDFGFSFGDVDMLPASIGSFVGSQGTHGTHAMHSTSHDAIVAPGASSVESIAGSQMGHTIAVGNSGTELGNWYDQNQKMFNMLEETFLSQ